MLKIYKETVCVQTVNRSDSEGQSNPIHILISPIEQVRRHKNKKNVPIWANQPHFIHHFHSQRRDALELQDRSNDTQLLLVCHCEKYS